MRIAALACSLTLAACQTTQAVTTACDVRYDGPPPPHLVEIGRSLNPMIVDLPTADVLEQCDRDTPIACVDAHTGLGWYFIIITTDASQWERHNLTRQQVIDHEMGHLAEIALHGSGNRCHTGWRQ